MRFHLTSEQVAIQDAVKGTLGECWGMERLHAFADGEADSDAESWQALMALGVGGLALPEAEGGAGLGLLDAALVCEMVGAAAAPGPVIGQIVTALALAACTNPNTSALLPGVARDETVAKLALDSNLVQSARAAQLFLTDDGAGGLQLIEAGDGIEIETVSATDRSRPVSKVTFGTVTAHPLFAAGDPMVQRVRDAALVLIAADALGGAQHCTDLSVDYAKTREQFAEFRNASTVCPLSVRPLASVMVPEIMMGNSVFFFFKHFLYGHQCSLSIQRIENGFYQQQISATVTQSADLFLISIAHFVKRYCSVTGIVYLG